MKTIFKGLVVVASLIPLLLNAEVRLGNEVLALNGFKELKGKRWFAG